MVVGNLNLCFSATFGIWILGGVTSVGDVALEARAVALQVGFFGVILSALFVLAKESSVELIPFN